ncbi:MarR family winged helix-turn-helix transcriptional regulator [Micromonospora halophytica]|uniref:DNA-binding transcriptional regulator, MarR family n=1 Tax=Micromonospora halophytica TaxID=47864 RepID=A0A1C5I6B4_9ACTN|nr:MarR family transcriptional regulator [Micromonospora halophytica]SCG53695.1 DNA-binding transcriptional regulator, MarR family [Micromonospora halophytica]
MPDPTSGPALLGTRLRHLLELLDGDVAAVYADLGLPGFRPRYTPVVRALADAGPQSIRELAQATGVTHSAASQTVAQMTKDGLVTLTAGADARQRIVRLTTKAESLLPVLDAEWAATAAAARRFEAELSYPLSRLVDEALAALRRRSMRQRIADVALHPAEDDAGPDRPGAAHVAAHLLADPGHPKSPVRNPSATTAVRTSENNRCADGRVAPGGENDQRGPDP